MEARNLEPQGQTAKANALMERNWLPWWIYNGVIFPKDGSPTGFPLDGVTIKPNPMQKTLQNVINWFRTNELPIRITLLKPRQQGSSTMTSAVCYHFLSSAPPGTVGVLSTGNEEQAKPMFAMLDRYAKYDKFFTGNPCEVSTAGLSARWQNGNELRHATLGGKASLVGGAFHFMWCTELGLVDSPGDDNIKDAKQRLENILIAVPDTPNTIVIEESTARGATGVFYDRYMDAEPWEEIEKNGKFTKKTRRVSLFFPWHIFDTSLEVPTLSPEDDAEYLANLSSAEREYHARVLRETGVSLTGTQMSWRNHTLANKCGNDEEKFDRDFPYSVNAAFTKSGNPRFSRRGLALLKQRLQTRPQLRHVNLTLQGTDPFSRKDRLSCVTADNPNDATIWMYEQPLPGRRYIVIVDPCIGKIDTGNKDPDSHGIMVMRSGFRDNHGVWNPLAQVAVCGSLDGGKRICRWEPGYAEQIIWKLSRYYGGNNLAPIVIELPLDAGMIRSLKDKGAVLYVQRKPNAVEESESVNYGFVQTANTRVDIIGQLAQRIIENFSADDGTTLDGGGIQVNDEETIRELENFVTKPNGRVEAGVGHDDLVLSLAMGVACESSALPYAPPVGLVPQFELEDRRWLAQQQRGGGGRARW